MKLSFFVTSSHRMAQKHTRVLPRIFFFFAVKINLCMFDLSSLKEIKTNSL